MFFLCSAPQPMHVHVASPASLQSSFHRAARFILCSCFPDDYKNRPLHNAQCNTTSALSPWMQSVPAFACSNSAEGILSAENDASNALSPRMRTVLAYCSHSAEGILSAENDDRRCLDKNGFTIYQINAQLSDTSRHNAACSCS